MRAAVARLLPRHQTPRLERLPRKTFWSSSVFEVQVNGEHWILKLIRERRQALGHNDGAQSGNIKRWAAAAGFNGGVRDRAVALNRKFHSHHPGSALFVVPCRSNAFDHRDDVVGAAEIGDIERRARS